MRPDYELMDEIFTLSVYAQRLDQLNSLVGGYHTQIEAQLTVLSALPSAYGILDEYEDESDEVKDFAQSAFDWAMGETDEKPSRRWIPILN